MSRIDVIKQKYERQVGKKEQLESDIESLKVEIITNSKHLKNLEKAREIVKLVDIETKKQLQYHISDVTSLALDGVFSDPYKLVTEFVERRGQIECDLRFERDGNILKPKDAAGFGAMDIASLALRVAAWSMKEPRTRPFILLDEPFKHLSEEYHEAGSEILKELSDKLGLQLVVITHTPALSTYADRTFKLSLNKNKETKIKQL